MSSDSTPILPTATVPIEDGPDLSNPERNSTLWFRDGTLVLKTPTASFRIYGGLLGCHCAVFKDMLSVPQPSVLEESQMIEGCPVIEMTDEAKDLHHFLMAIHQHGYFEERSTFGPNFQLECIASVLRLSTKYEAPFFRQRCVARLSVLYPATLEEWDAQLDVRLPIFLGQSKLVVQLARQCRLPVLLPSALYDCATMKLEPLLDPTERDDGEGGSIDLDWPDKRLCLIARNKLRGEFRTRSLAFLQRASQTSPPHCESQGHCSAGASRLLTMLDGIHVTTELGFPLDEAPLMWILSSSRRNILCPSCMTDLEISFRTVREEIWEKLPTFFDLLDWEELRTVSE